MWLLISRVSVLSLLAYFLILFTKAIHADEGYYVDTNAAYEGNAEVDLRMPPVAIFESTTSAMQLSDTLSTTYISFIGTFSSSGPHPLQPFALAEMSSISITLTRVIGDLKGIFIENDSTDRWLPISFRVHIGSLKYQFKPSIQWIGRIDPQTVSLYTSNIDPYNPNPLPCSTTLHLKVLDSFFDYSETGSL